MASRSGGFSTWFYGFLVGGVIGVAVCAGVAYFITKAPIPFISKDNQASERINPLADGTVPDPNKPLNASSDSPSSAPKSQVATVESPTQEQSDKEAAMQQDQGSRFVVQAGSFNSQESAENRRAELGLLGYESRIIPRTEKGVTLYRVRLGPYGTSEEANNVKTRLAENKINAQVGRIK